MAAVELAIRKLDVPEVGGVTYDEVVEAGEHIPGMAALWDVATAEERREMVLLLLEPGGLYYDLEQKIIAALKPRPAFLPILRMLNGIVEYDEAKGLLLVERWQDRNRRASDYLQDTRRDRQTQPATFSLSYTSLSFYSLRIQERIFQVASTGIAQLYESSLAKKAGARVLLRQAPLFPAFQFRMLSGKLPFRSRCSC
jgi:hypothetical protein